MKTILLFISIYSFVVSNHIHISCIDDDLSKEFFCAPLLDGTEFVCPEPDDIMTADRGQIRIDENIVQIEYKIMLEYGRILLCNWFIHYTKTSYSSYSFGLIGAVG